jgi:hypothetical protein
MRTNEKSKKEHTKHKEKSVHRHKDHSVKIHKDKEIKDLKKIAEVKQKEKSGHRHKDKEIKDLKKIAETKQKEESGHRHKDRSEKNHKVKFVEDPEEKVIKRKDKIKLRKGSDTKETDFRHGLHFKKGHFDNEPELPVRKNEKKEYKEIEPLHRTRDVSVARGTKRALLIGINYIGSENELNGCINDVKNVKNLLTTKFGYKEENIRLLSDDQCDENKPTKQNILDNIGQFVGKTKPGDVLFIQYSAHGTQVPCQNHSQDSNPDTPGEDDALCPLDFDSYDGYDGFITNETLKEILVNKIPVGAKLRFFADCCHSGGILDLPFLYRNGSQFMQLEPLDAQSPDCLSISGCKDNQTSADAMFNHQYAGALTWSLLKALESYPKMKMSWHDLLTTIRHTLIVGHYDQIPQLCAGDQKLLDTVIDI